MINFAATFNYQKNQNEDLYLEAGRSDWKQLKLFYLYAFIGPDTKHVSDLKPFPRAKV